MSALADFNWPEKSQDNDRRLMKLNSGLIQVIYFPNAAPTKI